MVMMWYKQLVERHLRKAIRYFLRQNSRTATRSSRAHVCIVGSGPAGFYTAQQLLKVRIHVHIQRVLSEGIQLLYIYTPNK